MHEFLFFWTLNSSILVYMSTLCPDPTVLITTAEKSILKLGHVSPPILFFLSSIILAIWGPLQFHMYLRVEFFIYQKKIDIGILIGIALNLWTTLRNNGILSILSSNLWTWNVFPFIKIFFNLFHNFCCCFQYTNISPPWLIFKDVLFLEYFYK